MNLVPTVGGTPLVPSLLNIAAHHGREFSVHFQQSIKEKLLTAGVKEFHTPTNLFQNISNSNKIMQIMFIPQLTFSL